MPQRAHNFHLFIANAIGAEIRRRFHGNETQKLQQVILHHVAQRSGRFVVTGAAFHPERFRRGDLNVIDVARIPDRLENRVRETQHQNVLRRLFAEKMIDPVSLIFRKGIADDPIKLARRRKIAAKRFFHHHARPASFPRFV